MPFRPFLKKEKMEYPSEKRGYQNELCEIFWVFLRPNVRDNSSKRFITWKCPFFHPRVHPEVPRFELFLRFRRWIFLENVLKMNFSNFFMSLGLTFFAKSSHFELFWWILGQRIFSSKEFKIKKVLFQNQKSSVWIISIFSSHSWTFRGFFRSNMFRSKNSMFLNFFAIFELIFFAFVPQALSWRM